MLLDKIMYENVEPLVNDLFQRAKDGLAHRKVLRVGVNLELTAEALEVSVFEDLAGVAHGVPEREAYQKHYRWPLCSEDEAGDLERAR